MNNKNTKGIITLKKTLGITDSIIRMVEDDRYCPEIIQQIDAAIGLLNSAKRSLLESHLHHCLEVKLKESKDKTIEELLKIYNLNK